MSKINEEIEKLEHLKKDIVKNKQLKQTIDEIIKLKQRDDNIEKTVKDFIEKFDDDLENKNKHQDTKLLVNLYNNFVQYLYKPSEFQKHIIHIKNKLQMQLEQQFNDQQIILLRQLDFCNIRLQDEIGEQAFVAGFAMCEQMKQEAINKYRLN